MAAYKDFEEFNEVVAEAVKENRVLKVGNKWRVFGIKEEKEEAPKKRGPKPKAEK